MSSRLVRYHERRCTEAYTLCCDDVLLASYSWDVYAIEVDVLTARTESHGINGLCLIREGWKDSEAGDHSPKTTRCADSDSFICE